MTEGLLHHIGYLTNDIEQSAKKFCDRFGYKAESEIIEDDIQTAYVQFLRQPGAISWLELVMPNGEDSKLATALKKRVNLHHLCYEVENISKSTNNLRDQNCFCVFEPAPAKAFGGRNIAWLVDENGFLIELLESGDHFLSLKNLKKADNLNFE